MVVVLGMMNMTESYFEVFFGLKAFPVYLEGVSNLPQASEQGAHFLAHCL